MKTMKFGEEIKRVKEKDVDSFLENGWNYCPKHEWKEKVRKLEKKKETKKKGEKSKRKS